MIPFRWKFTDPQKVLYAKTHDGSVPWTVEIHLTNVCNFDCVYCDYRQRRRIIHDQARQNVIENLLTELVNGGVRGIIWSGGGETLMWKNGYVFELIRDYGRWNQVALITNGAFLPVDFYSWVHECTYVLISYHGYRQVLDAVRRAVRGRNQQKALCNVGVNMVVAPMNYQRLVDNWMDVKQLNPDYILLCPSKDYEEVGGIELTSEMIEKVKQGLEEAGIDQDPDTYKDMFWKGWEEHHTPTKVCHSIEKRLHAYITADGEIYLCVATAGEREFSIGNINDNRFSHIWNSERHKEIIAKLNKNPCERRNCRFKVYNKILSQGGDAPPWSEMRQRHGGIL